MSQDVLQIALEHHRAGRLTQAEAGYRAVLEKEPANVEASHWLGVLTYQAGRAAEASVLLERAAAARPDDAASHHNLGQAYLGCGRYTEAIVALGRADALLPGNPQTLLAAALARLARKSEGDASIAVDLLDRARAAGLNDSELEQYRAAALLAVGRVEDAIAAGRAAVEKRPDNAEAFFHLGTAYRQKGELEPARWCMTIALDLNPSHVRACYALAVMEAEAENHEAAEALFRRAIELRPDSAAAYQGLATLLRHLDREQEAGPLLAQAKLASRGQIPRQAPSGHTAAIADLERRMTPSPHSAALHFRLAVQAGISPPAKIPTESLSDLFQRYADLFDEHLRGKLDYRAPELIAEAVAATHPSAPLDVLDLGCGTGLCGPPLRSLARIIHGVDLSSAMIKKAAQRGVYDRLEVGELIQTMTRLGRSFDLIVAADVFIYVGDLAPAFEAVAACLRPGGMFAFSVEAGEGDRFRFDRRARRFTHSRPYLRHLAKIYGFREETLGEVVLRQEARVPVAGYLALLRLPSAEVGPVTSHP